MGIGYFYTVIVRKVYRNGYQYCNFKTCAENEKEPEMQIGFPTDVKHVAHIGWDGPSVSSPSWVCHSPPLSFFLTDQKFKTYFRFSLSSNM